MAGSRPLVAFYAPLKSPRSETPSGDRTMARLLMAALDEAGLEPRLATELRGFEPSGDEQAQRRIAEAGAREADRLIAGWRQAGAERPALWFTYHCYYKAPDWIGPIVSQALAIPYVVAEGSRAPKRATGPFAFAHCGAEAALDTAAILFSMTAQDRPCLVAARPPHQRIVDLPPFIVVGESPPSPKTATPTEPLRLLTVAMMREGDKSRSYALLAESLKQVRDIAWTLDIVGDGPARPVVEDWFASFGGAVRFHGRIDTVDELARLYGAADLFVWPAVNEAYGMVFLEALAAGCPVLAGDEGGVASVVSDGETGLLVPRRDVAAFAEALLHLARDEALRRRLGAAGAAKVRAHHSLPAASATLRSHLMPLLEQG